MTSSRRIGTERASNRQALIDAAAVVLQEEGYAALTARRIAEQAGLKPQLVHYYFRTMDDLVVAVIRKWGDEGLKRVVRASTSKELLKALWKSGTDDKASALAMEVLAMAMNRDSIREETLRFLEQERTLQREAIERHFEAIGYKPGNPPMSIIMVLTGIARLLAREKALGFSLGHDEIEAGVEAWLDSFYAQIPDGPERTDETEIAGEFE